MHEICLNYNIEYSIYNNKFLFGIIPNTIHNSNTYPNLIKIITDDLIIFSINHKFLNIY